VVGIDQIIGGISKEGMALVRPSGFHSSLATERCFLASGNQAGVDGEPIGSDQPFGHAALDDGFEQMAQQIALAKAPVPVLGKGRVVRDLVIQTEAAKPAIGEIEMLPLFIVHALGSNLTEEALRANRWPRQVPRLRTTLCCMRRLTRFFLAEAGFRPSWRQ
jgi:hypothetical protein